VTSSLQNGWIVFFKVRYGANSPYRKVQLSFKFITYCYTFINQNVVFSFELFVGDIIIYPFIIVGPPSVVYWPEFLATDPEVRVRFPALPHFLRSSGSGTGSTQPREYN
jgi:hypothetical protein